MATLVLTVVGTLVGGPIGGAIGAFVGQQVDQMLFAPKGRQGPRLGDLAVQTSTYGQAIPRIFGRLRVAGSVIWATELQEHAKKHDGGKGQPDVTTYSYSVSFAVALSARAILSVGRIWADGKLLRGAGGDWKSQTGFRLYLGDEDQPLDPLLASAEGMAATPAYRGIAYAVFEDFQLADYGNRIPSLTFELIADAADPAVTAIAEELGPISAEGTRTLTGYAASGDSLRAAIEPLATAAGLTLREEADGLWLRPEGGAAVLLGAQELGAAAKERGPRAEVERQSSGTLPDAIALSYYEPARDFQAGVQAAQRGGPGRRGERIELAAALDAPAAKRIAEEMLARRWTERARATVRLPWRRLECWPGSLVRLSEGGPRWRVAKASVERMLVELSLVAADAPQVVSGAGSAGQPVLAPDRVHGPTTLALIDLPPLSDAPETSPILWAAAAGESPGWRRAALLLSLDDGTSWDSAGTSAAPAVLGATSTVLGAGDAALFDRAGSVEVQLLHDEMLLQSRSDDALLDGANAAMLGDELIQFGSAEALGDGRWRLSRLLRGRRGTEWAIARHALGERFVLLERTALAGVPLPLSMLGRPVRLMASGVGDGGSPVEIDAVAAGAALWPPSPVHLSAARLADGTIRVGWVRRSRVGWAWLPGADTPLGEESERYQLRIEPSAGAPREIECPVAAYEYGTGEQAADGSASAASVTITVRQLGAFAPSLPATASFAV